MSNPSGSRSTTSFPSHQLSSGLYVSGRPDQHKEKAPKMSAAAMPYTGGDVKKSGELGKMFEIQAEASKAKRSGQSNASGSRSGSLGAAGSHAEPLAAAGSVSPAAVPRQGDRTAPLLSNSGPLSAARHTSRSGSLGRSADPAGSGQATPKTSANLNPPQRLNPSKHSGPLAANLPATGLITSGPISSGPVAAAGASRKLSGPLDSAKLMTGHAANNQAINNLSHDRAYSFRKNFPRVILWTLIPLFVMGFIAGGFILSAVKNAILLIFVAALFAIVLLLIIWNVIWGKRALLRYISRYSDAELGGASDRQCVKVTGVVTCGNVSLESSFQKISRCIYTSTGLYEYRGMKSLPANDKHRHLTWGLRHLERHVVDFYVSDFQSGLRILVKAGYGATVAPYVDERVVLELSNKPQDIPQDFLHWLAERNLSRDERTMRLSEGFIKEGSTVTVFGVVQRHDNVLMLIAPPEPISTGFQWPRLLLPATIDGIILRSEDSSTRVDVA